MFVIETQGFQIKLQVTNKCHRAGLQNDPCSIDKDTFVSFFHYPEDIFHRLLWTTIKDSMNWKYEK